MATADDDDLLAFSDVRVIRSTAPALLCRIGDRSVWLPRGHISGKLWCAGDRGKLFIRRWIARDRQLIPVEGTPIPFTAPFSAPSPHPVPSVPLHLVRREAQATGVE
jgi:hypothetical protein